MEELTRALLGWEAEADRLVWYQAILRAAIMYLAVLAIVRLGKKRFMGRGTVFDVVVGIIIGSLAGRAIAGATSIEVAIAAIAALVALHWLFSGIAVHWRGFGTLVKGRSRVLIRDGEVDERELRRTHLTHADLEEDLRKKGQAGTDGIQEARLERDGSVSVLTRSEPRVLEVKVEAGVQTVRIELG